MADGYWIWKTKRYKKHFICFSCRKNFKQPNAKDLAEKNGDLSLLLNAFYYSKPKKEVAKHVVDYLKEEYFYKKVFCPQCNEEMVEVPMSFETPAKKNIKEWEALHSVYRGRGFVYNGVPTDKKSLIVVMEAALQWHVKMLQNADNHKSYGESLPDARIRLREELQKLDAEVQRLKNEE